MTPSQPYSNFDIGDDGVISGKDFIMQIRKGTNSISGKVVKPDSSGAAGVYVAAVEEQPIFADSYFIQVTDAHGNFSFTNLKDGKWRVGVFHGGASIVPFFYYHTLNNNKVKGDKFVISFPTGVENGNLSNQPEKITLWQNYPNPFNANTEIRYSLPQKGDVQLIISNTRGQVVQKFDIIKGNDGVNTFNWNSLDKNGMLAPSGVYFYTLRNGSFIETRKMLLLR